MIRGRQLLKHVYERYRQQEHMGAWHTYEDSTSVTSKGLSLDQSKAKWDFVTTGRAQLPYQDFAPKVGKGT